MLWRDTYDPFADVRRLQSDMNRLFSGYATTGEAFPALNIYSNEEGVIVRAELPGMNTADIDITVKGRHLTLKGDRKPDELAEGVACHRAERSSGSFTRTIELPFEADSEKVTARYELGVLEISLPRTEQSKAKKIAIQA